MTIEAVEVALEQHPDVRLVYVFGSVASGRARFSGMACVYAAMPLCMRSG